MMRINFDTLRRAWKHPSARKMALASGVVVVGAAGLAAMESRSGLLSTPAPAACCTSAISVGESSISPAIGADKDFFEVPSSPPSVFFLLGTNRSMQEYATDPATIGYMPKGYLPEDVSPTATPAAWWYTDTYVGNFVNSGCSDTELLKKMGWFDKTNPAGAIPYDADLDLESTATTNASGASSTTKGNAFFDPGLFYHVKGWRVGWQYGNEDYPYSMNSTFNGTVGHTDITYVCKRLWNNNGDYTKEPAKSAYNECVSCLTNKGWWRGPMGHGLADGAQGPKQYPDEPTFPAEARRKWIVSGRVLNLHPPKFVVARKVLKDVIATAPNVRMGLATFGENHGWYDPPAVLRDIQPGCSVSYPTIDEAGLDRVGLMKTVNNALFRNKERSIGEAIFGLGAYFSSQGTDGRWKTWFGQPIGTPEFGWPGQPNGGTNDDTSPPYYTGAAYGKASDEWLKGSFYDPDTKITAPAMRFEQGGDNKSVCFACQVSSTIVITDGIPKYDNSVPITKMMSLLIADGARHEAPGKPLVTFDSKNPATNLNSGGINYCDQFGVDKTVCDYADKDFNWPTGLTVGNRNFMDDVAFFMAHMDLRGDTPGVQAMRTYTVGYAVDPNDKNPMLKSIAKAGKGKFYQADNPAGLRTALLDALGDIKQQSTSFASSNIAGVQTGSQSSTFVPRFVPRRGRPYEGHLYRFFYFNEFAQGCQAVKTGFHAADLNQDGDCDDSFYLDKPAGFSGSGVPAISAFKKDNIVQENDEGNWIKLSTATVSGGIVKGGVDAQPFWDLAETLNKRRTGPVMTSILDKDGNDTGKLKEDGDDCDFDNPLKADGSRCIFTVIDRNKDGKFTAEDNPPVEFSAKNATVLKDYLLAAGDTFCKSLMARSNTGVYGGTAEDQETCARVLIQFVRGKDVFDYDGDGVRTEGRPCADESLETPFGDAASVDPEVRQHRSGQKTCKLADIFHSTPVVVEPPVEPFLCSLGLSGQCLSTLYEDFSYSVTSEPLCGTGGGKPCYKATPMAVERSSSKRNGIYDDLLADATVSKRYRVVLVGSNGGMLHAVHVGTANQTKKNNLDSIYDVGTGQELWAFVPPDLMPKLNMMALSHEYYVDGTSMVRDIWTDGANGPRDGKKQKEEFRTIAITGERSGGQRYLALDMTDPLAMLKSVKANSTGDGPFRWMFPNACDKESLTMGESWSNFAPKPPPIGPVRIKATPASPVSDQDRGWEERWVAILNGGYSPDLSRGRGMYMLDAWSGVKLWAAEAHPGTGSSGYAGVLNTMQPMAASAALVDIGKGQGLRSDLDGFFDTMLVGDMGGQMWTFRFRQPGDVDTSTGLVKNWFGARSLEVARDDGSVNGHEKAPFFQVASSVIQPDTGWLRSFIGTGDRQHLRTTPGSDCSSDDLLACIRLKCDVKASFVGELNGQQRTNTIEYKAGVLTSSSENWAATGGGACSAARYDLTELTYSCPAAAYGSAIYPSGAPPTYKTESRCAFSSGQWDCTERKVLNTVEKHDQILTAEEKITVGTNRFFGFHSYGGNKRVFETEAEAVAFDAMRVTDKVGAPCPAGVKCSLVDVTIPDAFYGSMVDADGTPQRFVSTTNLNKMKPAGSEDPGWFVRYTNTSSERTATGSTVLAGVVFWSSFSPSTTAASDVCSLATMNDRSYAWQADAISGLPDQASGFQLANKAGFIASRARKTAAPPGEPSPVVAMSTTGGIRYEVAISSAGTAPSSEKLSTRKNTTPDISWMEVPRNLHECRHENSEACAEGSAP